MYFLVYAPMVDTNKLTPKEANDKLRFGIAVLKGEILASIWKRRLHLALIIKEGLLSNGYVWQARRIDNWIHRLQPRKADLRETEGGSV